MPSGSVFPPLPSFTHLEPELQKGRSPVPWGEQTHPDFGRHIWEFDRKIYNRKF